MRSRYTAYTKQNWSYLLKTWHPDTQPPRQTLQSNTETRWSGLTIVRTEKGRENDTKGIVEFIATFQHQGVLQQFREISQFVKENSRWFYLGQLPDEVH
jgi:SEC-C motif-containing protein